MSQSFASIAQTRYNTLQANQSSIELMDTNVLTNNSIELPEEIDSLIDNKAFRNRYKKLIRLGFEPQLRYLARYANRLNAEGKLKEGKKPSFLFAKMCSVARWENTLAWANKAMNSIAKIAAEVAERIGATPEQMKPIFKACWRLKENAIRYAVTAQETAKTTRFKYFCWLASAKHSTC